jgi:hypothetical protein
VTWLRERTDVALESALDGEVTGGVGAAGGPTESG